MGETIIVPMPYYGEPEVETWRPIPGLRFYEASSFGRIRSLDRILHHRGRWNPKVRRPIKGRVLALRTRPNAGGNMYMMFNCANGVTASVSRCVCAAFHGRPPSRHHEAAHLNGETTNNRPKNLMWATPLQNAAHKHLHGTVASGSRNGTAKITEADVIVIRAAADAGEKHALIAARFNIAKGTVQRIANRTGWRCVPEAAR